MDIFEMLAKGEAAQVAHDAEVAEDELLVKSAKRKKMSPFDALTGITMKKYGLNLPEDVRDYEGVKFMVNRGLSQEVDTLVHAYIMSTSGANLPPEMHYDYYYHAVRKGKRYTKWAKADKYENVDLIIEIYQVSKPKAIAILDRLTDEDLTRLVTWYESRSGGLTR
ncbi:clamp loader A subunit [Vibrio phage 1.081.O._10N.286.52.C2]|nr:clamp loader A subunit [Vibrio phage 1.081.O._10N.286.52.C2]